MSEAAPSLFPWRAPAGADWAERFAVLDQLLRRGGLTDDEATTFYVGLRRLAGEQAGVREQLRLEGLARRALKAPEAARGFRRMRVGLLANRTLSYLAAAVPACGLARGLLVDCVEAPYDTVAAVAFGGEDPFPGEALDAAVVMLDLAAFERSGALLDLDGETSDLDRAEQYVAALAATLRQRAGCPVIVATAPAIEPRTASADTATPGTAERFRARLNMRLADGAARGDWILWDLAALAGEVGHAGWFDPGRFHLAKIPFRVEISPRAADSLCALLAAMAGKSARALVLDLDNTLWGGVIGDDGLDGIKIGQGSADGEAYLAFQRWLLGLRDRGVVLAVCSKNDDAVAREPFASHPDMLLREPHFAVFQANWDDKASNIQAIAEALNLGLESLAFVDDNPFEREQVRRTLPLVNVPEVGSDPSLFAERLAGSGLFEHMRLNRDDLIRVESYGAEARRAAVLNTAGDYQGYLASLDMELQVTPFDDAGAPRIAQLINKSNQFNLTTRRYNEEQVRAMATDPDVLCWQARLDDRFGSQGMIAVVIVRKQAGQWTIDSWLQSCRILKRGVEEALMTLLMDEARAAGVSRVTGAYHPSGRNGMVADFYDRLGFGTATGDDSGVKAYAVDPRDHAPLDHRILVRRPG